MQILELWATIGRLQTRESGPIVRRSSRSDALGVLDVVVRQSFLGHHGDIPAPPCRRDLVPGGSVCTIPGHGGSWILGD
jgi:hypothetical protein